MFDKFIQCCPKNGSWTKHGKRQWRNRLVSSLFEIVQKKTGSTVKILNNLHLHQKTHTKQESGSQNSFFKVTAIKRSEYSEIWKHIEAIKVQPIEFVFNTNFWHFCTKLTSWFLKGYRRKESWLQWEFNS